MTATFLSDGSQATAARAVAVLVVPIAGWVAFSLWRGYSIAIVLGVAVLLGGLSLWAIRTRGAWKQITVDDETLVLQGPGVPDVVILRDSILKLELRDQLIVVKWRTSLKDRVEVLAREGFSGHTWNSLRESLRPWQK